MIKVMLLVRRRPDLSRAEFRRYYETRHAPLAARSLAHCIGYARNFATGPDDGTGPDCITEFRYDLDPPWEQARAMVTDDATRAVLAADEANFMDRASMTVLVVEECVTPPGVLSARPGRDE